MTSASRRDRWRLRAGTSFTRVRPRLRGASKEGEMSHEYSNPDGPYGGGGKRLKEMLAFAGGGAASGPCRSSGGVEERPYVVGRISPLDNGGAGGAPNKYVMPLTPDQIKMLEDAGGGAVKADTGKLRVDLFPGDALFAISEILTFGANKYTDR